jgi:hypothetical protein
VFQGFKFSHFMKLVFTDSVMTSWTRFSSSQYPTYIAQKIYRKKSSICAPSGIFVNQDASVRAIDDRICIRPGSHAELASNYCLKGNKFSHEFEPVT